MVWGESNSREFLDWADFCRNNALKQRGVNNSGGPNFQSDHSSGAYQSAKETILNLIQKNRTISVQQLYNTMPLDLLTNPTTKHVMLQLYYEDNLQIQSQQTNNSDRETNFVLVFVKRAPKPQSAPKMPNAPQKKQSNIEDLIDNDWRASGRKLDFDKKELPKREELNINLKRNPQPTLNVQGVKPVVDVRDKVKPPKIDQIQPKVITPKPIEIPEIKNESITYIEIPKPKPEIKEEIIQPTVSLNLQFRPEPNKVEVAIEDKVFYGLSAYELYFIEAFLADALHKEENKEYVKITKEIVKARADVIYLQNKDSINFFLKILIALLCLVIIGIFIAMAVSKNKVRAKAFKDYNKQLKIAGYVNMKSQLKEKHPKIIEF
ncbi:hypothetical protein SCULI_v1c10100 [Spiroplasma culicicola AES-1]|uniref:Transmembrane protein n=2 Tax=Spiroplasma culicicola TaxID=216935 RepID=W6A8Y2_9MOLU|nr:hypothetical protein SCULI_v1c10100 [Spiroplasma culicicola AES-1]